MNETIIKIINLSFIDVFEELNINFSKNKFTIITGPNNCGKTSLIRILARKYAYMGEIIVNDKNILDYKIDDYYKMLNIVIPEEILFICDNYEDEISLLLTNVDQNTYKELIKKLKLNKYKNQKIELLDTKTKIKIQLMISLLSDNDIIIIDDISTYYDKKEMVEIIETIKYIKEKTNKTIIMATSTLENSLYADYLYIVANSQIILEGEPIEVLQKDNIINKVGLNVPFMIDLSVKLRDYDLIKEIELDMNRMVDTLWK